MTRPPLRVACSDPGLLERLRHLADGVPVEVGPDPGPHSGSRSAWHLVVDTSPGARGVDVVLGPPAELEQLWADRILPWAQNLAAERRAPRARTAVLERHREDWHDQADRLLRRVVRSARAQGITVIHADHIGSTSVCGLRAKPLLDLQLVSEHLPDGERCRVLADAAGLVAVAGEDFYAIDRHDRRHPERILVDADPGMPVNVHLHARSSAVWRETLAFRDWLRADPRARAEYEGFKHRLAQGSDVDGYSRAKRSWVNSAVGSALRWSAAAP